MATTRVRGNTRSGFIVLLLLAAVALLAWPYLRGWWAGQHAEPRAVTARGALADDEKTTIAVFEAASPAVVNITTLGRVVDYWSRDVMEVPQGSGSGFFWDEAGHVVTNFHVIAGADRATLRLSDGRSFDATLVGASPEHDIAVLRIGVSANAPVPLPIGASGDLKVGQKVFAIGNPFGLDHTLTSGVISALDRSMQSPSGHTIEHVIQTDAAINPGNSGGPLIDSAGRLIGINTQIYSTSGAFAGIGFAVPVDTVNRVVPRLIADGRYLRPVLGIQTDDEIGRRVLEQVGIEGLLVLRVSPNTPAERAGLEPTRRGRDGEVILGDVIQAIDGTAVRDLGDLTEFLDGRAAGDTVELTIWRDGSVQAVKVTLGGGR